MSIVPNIADGICKDLWREKNVSYNLLCIKCHCACGSFYLGKNTMLSLVHLKDILEPLIGCQLAMLPSKLSWDGSKVNFTLRFSYVSPWGGSITQTEGINLQPGLFFSDILQLNMISKVKNQLWESTQVKWWAACRQLAGAKREIVRNY